MSFVPAGHIAGAVGVPVPYGVPQTPSQYPPAGQSWISQSERIAISRSITYCAKIPKCHQIDAIAHVDKALDSTLTAKLDAQELAVVAWILTRIPPT